MSGALAGIGVLVVLIAVCMVWIRVQTTRYRRIEAEMERLGTGRADRGHRGWRRGCRSTLREGWGVVGTDGQAVGDTWTRLSASPGDSS